MAPADKRSQERMNDLEMQQASLSSRLDQTFLDISELKDILKAMDGRLANLGNSHGKQPDGVPNFDSSRSGMSFGAFHSDGSAQISSSYSIPTRNSRVEFPRFDGDDFRGWAYRSRQFFEVDGTPPEHRIRLLSIHLEGHALRWHQNFMRGRSFQDVRWEDYFRSMEAKFSDVRIENPLIALKKLSQGDESVFEYEKRFDELLSEEELPEALAVNMFIGGLRPDIQQLVLNMAPTSLSVATNVARLQEATVKALREHSVVKDRKSFSSAYGSYSKFEGNGSVHNGLDLPKSQDLGKKVDKSDTNINRPSSISKPTKQLSKKEMDERRKKGLCYWWPERFSSGHRCKESQVFTLVIDEEEEEFVDASEHTNEHIDGTINAIEGKVGTTTLKLRGRIKNQSVIILVDTGSTYNVINSELPKDWGCVFKNVLL